MLDFKETCVSLGRENVGHFDLVDGAAVRLLLNHLALALCLLSETRPDRAEGIIRRAASDLVNPSYGIWTKNNQRPEIEAPAGSE